MVTGESTKETVKTIAQGMPVDAVYPWLLTPVLFSAQAATGATRIRHSLRPLCFSRVVRLNNSDAFVPRDRGLVFLRHSGMVRSTRPGISRFRVHRCAMPRNDNHRNRLFEIQIGRCEPNSASSSPSLGNPKFPFYRRIVGYSWIGKTGVVHEEAHPVCGGRAGADVGGGESGGAGRGRRARRAVGRGGAGADRCGGRRRRGLYGGSAYRAVVGLPSITRPWRADDRWKPHDRAICGPAV